MIRGAIEDGLHPLVVLEIAGAKGAEALAIS
jgi:hypothetical protein